MTPPTQDQPAATTTAADVSLNADRAAFERALARTKEILRRHMVKQLQLIEEARTELALAHAELHRSRRVVPVDDGPHLDGADDVDCDPSDPPPQVRAEHDRIDAEDARREAQYGGALRDTPPDQRGKEAARCGGLVVFTPHASHDGPVGWTVHVATYPGREVDGFGLVIAEFPTKAEAVAVLEAAAESDAAFADRVAREAAGEVAEAIERAISADEEAAMNDIHGGAPGDESYCDANRKG